MLLKDKKDQFILIGNYPKDKQESMERFTQMLANGFRKEGYQTKVWKPKVIFGSLFNTTTTGAGKWSGYIDKWILFPIELRIRVFMGKKKNVHFHVCDHSNAPYLKCLVKDKTAITCHDVLAIRGALGFPDAHCPASTFGKLLQKWILNNLKEAKLLAAVSHLTLNQLNDLVPAEKQGDKSWRVIYNTFNGKFSPLTKEAREGILSKSGVNASTPFILHVGSSLPRKNRQLLLDMVATLGDRWKGNICFAGKEIDEKLKSHAEFVGLRDRIVSIVQPSHETLVALYSACEVFVFPSFSEGFGWPVIEAQACGTPVIASKMQPMPEISGGAALHADPTKPQEFADAFLSLQDKTFRNKIIEAGTKNCLRYSEEPIIRDYLNLHNLN